MFFTGVSAPDQMGDPNTAFLSLYSPLWYMTFCKWMTPKASWVQYRSKGHPRHHGYNKEKQFGKWSRELYRFISSVLWLYVYFHYLPHAVTFHMLACYSFTPLQSPRGPTMCQVLFQEWEKYSKQTENQNCLFWTFPVLEEDKTVGQRVDLISTWSSEKILCRTRWYVSGIWNYHWPP